MLRIAATMLAIVMASTVALSQEPPTQSPPPNQQNERASKSQKPSDSQQTAPSPIPPVVSTSEAGDTRRDTSAEHSKSSSEQPNWLEKFFYDIKITDVLLVFFTGVLAIYTGRLWYATAGLWDAAKEQSRDMKASIAVAARSAEATVAAAEAAKGTLESDRAWITWNMLTFGSLINSTIRGELYRNGIGISASWKNTGRSPAQNVTCINIARLIDRDASIPTFIVSDAVQTTQQTSRGVGEEISGFMIPFSDIDSDAIRNQNRRMIFYSRVTYRDVFSPGIERVSEACMEITYAGGTILHGDKEQPPVGVQVVGTQNRII
jgi:hypothetical protein